MKKSLIKISILAALSLIAHGNDVNHVKNMTMSRDLFRNEIKPLFNEHCLKCHGGDKTKSSFDLNTREGLILGLSLIHI